TVLLMFSVLALGEPTVLEAALPRTTLPRESVPAPATLTLLVAPSRTNPRLIVWLLVALWLMSPASSTALPPSVNAPAPARKVMPLNCVLAAKSLFVVRLVTPPNWSASVATGGAFPVPASQFVEVVQLPLPPPPIQVSVAA